MKNFKYIIIVLIALSSIIVGCKRKSDNMIHFSGHVLDGYTPGVIEGANVYLIAFSNGNEDTVAKLKTGADGSFDVTVAKKNGVKDYGIYTTKDGYDHYNTSNLYYPDKSEYKDINLYLYPFSSVQLHFYCISNDNIVGNFNADYFGNSYKNFKFKNNTDTTFKVEARPYIKNIWEVPISISRNGSIYYDTTYYIQFITQPHDTTKLDMLVK